MPIKRSKKVYRKRSKRSYRRRSYRRKYSNGFLSVKRFVIKTIIAGSDTLPGGTAMTTFTLGDVPGNSEFSNLFEEFKLKKVSYRWVLTRDPAFATTTANRGNFARIMFTHDHNDQTVPANFAELQQYQRQREVWLNESRPHTRWFTLKTNTLDVGYTGVATSNYSANYKRWVSVADSGTPWYGLKYVYDALYAGTQLFLECRYHLVFRGQK